MLQDNPPTTMAAIRRFGSLVSGNVQSNRMVVGIDLIAYNSALSASATAISKTRAAHLCTSITCHQAKRDNCKRSRTQARLSDPNYLRVPASVWNHIHYHNQIDKDYMEAGHILIRVETSCTDGDCQYCGS